MTAVGGDSAAVSVFVAVPPQRAFDVFTKEIDRWWRHGKKYRAAGTRGGSLSFECRLGGRLFETVETERGTKTIEVGSVVLWSPPEELALQWRNATFAPHEQTLVEVSFAPSRDGTMVRVKHSGWSTLPVDHVARHGLVGAAFARSLGLWWGGLMTGYRETIATDDPSS